MVVPARIAAMGNSPAEAVYIVSGEVRMQPDGSVIDRGNSDSFIVVCDSEGNYHATSPERLESVGEAVTPEQWAQTLENIHQQAAQAAANAMNGAEVTSAEEPLGPEPTPEPTALSRVPTDAKGEPMFEQAEDAATAWDALVEYSGGDVATAKEIAAVMAQEKRKEYERVQKLKPKGKTPAEILASKRDIAAEQSRTQLEYERWRQMAEVERGRAAAEQAERERAERAAQAEADRLRLERLNGVPDWRADTPEHARARGYRRSGPEVVERQGAVEAVRGKDVRVKFAKDTTADGVAAVIDVDDLQPSHVQGVRNVRHFIPEAQPKNRKDAVSKVSAQDIAWNIRPEEITGSITAYTGAPSVNARGETIQGNSRADALKWMYDNAPEQAARYKAYLVEHAADFGMDAADIEAMERPVLVNMLDVSDGEAIRLGQYVQADTESGGVERIRGRAAARKIGADMREYAERLLSSEDEDASISQLVAANGVKTLQWMNTRGYITDTQYASCFDRKGELTGNAAEDLKDVLYQGIFEGGSVEIEEMFAKLPAKVQRAILATAYRDYDSPEADSIRGEIQQAIVLYNEMMMYPQYAGAMNVESALTAVAAWSQQYAFDEASGESYLPAERFSNFALHLAAMYKGMSQRGLQKMFNNLYDTIQGVGEDTLFESVERTPHTIAEAVKKVLGIDYKPVNERNNGETGHVPVADDSEVGQRGGRGSTTDVGSRERVTGTGRAYERGAGAAAAGAGAGGVGFSEGGDPVGRSLSEREATELVGRMEAEAEVAPMVELTPENWLAQFGEDGMVDTPIGVVKMGENQFIKMYSRGRAEYFGMVYPTLYTPDVVLEEVDPKDGSERDSKYLFVKTFVEADGARIVHFESVTVKKDGMEVSISSHEIKDTAVKNKMQNDKILHLAEKLSPGSEWRLTETPSGSKRPDLVPASDGTSLSGKDSDNSADGQGKRDNIVGGQETPMSAKIKTASAEVNTDPTEAQKEAGNYKKGHVQVGTFDITIEQPQGSVRKGTDADGKQWESKMNNTYGYIRGAVGVDGDHIDVFISNDIDGWNGRKVFVVDQYNPDGSFDEHKVMLGFNDADEAKGDYLANYEQGWENGRRIDITGVNLEDFEKWIESSKRKTKPFGEYSSVKKDVVEEKNGGSGLNGRTGNTGSNGENENNGSKAAEIAHLEELLEKPGADKKLVRAEIARLRGEGQKAAKPDEGVEQVDADLAAKLRKSPGFELSTKKVKGKVTVNPKDYAPWRKTAEDNKRPQLRGVHYEEGLAMATDTASIIMVRSKYPTAWEGKTIGWDGKALDFEHGYVPWRELLSMRRKAAYAVDAAAFKAAVEQARADEASGEFNVSDYAIGVPYHGGKIYIALKRAELLADLLGNVKHGELRLNGTGQYLCLSGDGVYSIHMGVSKESLSYGLGTHVVDMPSGGVKQSKADGAVAEGVEASEAVLRDAVIERLREAGVEVVTDVAAGQKVLDEANEETGMSNAGQQQVRLHARLSALTKAANTIRGWLDGNKRGKTFTIELPEATRRMIRKVMGRDFDSHNITANGVVHAQKNHGVGGWKLNERSIPLTKVDMELMPYIMTAPDYVRRGSDDMSGRVSVRFYKELGNGYVVVAEKEYKNSPDDMETITMWAEMSDKATNAQREAALDTHVQNAILDIDAAKIRRDAENAIENDIKIREHRVYHGSGADFESFDHSHMGTGEGAQVFGWGTYVTEVEGIGRGYATKIVTNNSTNLSSIARQHNAKRFLKKYPTFEAFKAYVDETRPDKSDIALNYYNQNVDDAKGQRHLYTVEIPEDTGENYIDHDKGLTPSQATRVRTALEGIGVDLEDFARRGWRLDMPFEYVYNIMIPNAIRGSRYEVAGNVQRKASEFLSQLGFTGIKYPAEYTKGGRADGAKNYVIFDDKDLKITDHVRFFRTGEGEAYGFTVGGKIYIDSRIATAETPVHEYAHLWAEALRCGNAEEWSNVVGLMKDTPVWDEVRERYPELESEDEIADEVIATYSGRRGAERLREEAKKVAEDKDSVFEKAEAIRALERVKQALARFWKGVCDFLHIRYTSAEEVADRVMKDMMEGINPREVLRKNEQNTVIQRVNPMEDDYHTGVRGVEDIRTLREAIAEARAEGEEGGWDALSSYPDVSNAMLEAALRSGRVRVYSSKPIEEGVFVTPSRMQAEDYAGGGKVYSKEVSVDDVAWLNTDEGQLADVISKDETGMLSKVRMEAARRRSEEAERRDKELKTQDIATAIVTGKTEAQARAERRERERKFKEETKELYARVLSGDFNEVTLRLINDYLNKVTPLNYYGRPLSKRLPARALRKMPIGERTGSVDALFSRISESTVGAHERTGAEAKRRIEEKKKELLKGWAIATGNWYTSVSDFTDDKKPIGSGKDSDVYHGKDGESVVKVSKGKEGLTRWRPDMDNVALFNYVFPGSKYEIIGYGEIDGKFVRFLRQPIVDFADSKPLTVDERVAYMERLGFRPLNAEKTAFTNGEIVASDIQGNNIVKDSRGNVRVIDADMRLHTKDVGGEYTYAPVKKDTEIMSKDETGMSSKVRFQYVGADKTSENIEAANARFNAELELQIDGKLPIGHVYKMGRPSEFLRAAGIPNLPIELPASQLSLKASSGKHDFDLQEVRDLPKAIANPIATFAYGDKGKLQNILTLLDHNGEKFLVGIFIRPTVKGRVLEVNSIRNVFPKNSESIVRWILDGKLTNANKKGLLAFLDQQRTNLADVAFVLPAEQAKQGIQEVLETAAKVVKEFENPNVSGEKDAEAGQNENNGNAGNYENYENNGKNESDMRYRTSEELDSEYGRRWLDEQTNSDGRHTTQVKNTLSSYQKFGEWVKREARGREVDVLDASSGLGIGTEWMRDNGIKVEDVEPYPSERRAAPTYKSYGDINKKYDYIISNAVLNVIPDDWRAGVLHDMADKLKDGGRMVINVRSAESIRRQGKEGETRITLDDPSEILVLRPDGSIKAYQKGFTKTELKEWCEKELGAGYKVEIANKGNAGGSYDTAVVVTKNNESGTVGVASETGRPSRSAQAVSNSDAKVGKKSEYRDGLEEISDRLDEKAMGAHEFLYNIAKAFGLKGEGLRASFYQDLGNSVGIRVSDHSANTDNIASKNANSEVYGLVVKLGGHRFKSNADADYLEYVYYPDRLDGARQKEIVDGLKGFVDSGDYTLLPKPDRVNRSGRFEVDKSGFSDEKTGNNSDPEVMTARARELAELLNTPVRIIRTEEEVAALPSVRQRRMKGSFNPMTGEVTIVVPNNANMADIENTFVHEVVGHDGLRVLFPDEAKLNNALDELYRVSKDEIRGTIDRMAQKMYDAEVDRIREKKRKEHEANGEDATASYYTDMAAAYAEAGKKREQFKRDATEEYGADLAGRIGDGGFEMMSAEELTFWGKLKAMLQKALQRLLDGLKMRGKRQWGDKEWAFVLHEAFKRKRNGGRPTVFDMADTEVMRRKTGFGEMSNVESYGRDGKGNQKETVNLQYGKRLGQNQSGEYRRPEGSADGREVDTDTSRRLAAVSDRSDIRVFEEGHSAHREQHIDDSQRYRREAEGERLVAIAKANGLFIPREKIKSFGERVSKQSRESEVYINFDESRVYKVKNPYAMAGSWYKNHIEAEDAIYEYLLHNKYFPETAYKFEGIAEDVDGVRIVLSQPLIKSRRTATNEEVKAYLESKGFRSEPPYFYTNDDVWVSDFNGDNALIGEDGQVYLIDPVIDIDTHKTMKDLIGDSDRDGGIKFRDGEVGLGEAIAQMKEAASLANVDNRQAKEDAMKAIGGNLSKLRQAMARQRGYDLSTVKSITDLVKRMLENGLLDDLGKAETKRILSAAANVTGREDTSKYVQKVMDIMVDNQLRRSRDALGRLLSIRGKRVDGRGIEVQGALDANGVAVLQAFKKSKGLDWATIDERISDAFNRMSSEDDALAEEATLEYSGLVFARQ